MKYVSLFSGIEAASVAWGPLGWEPVAFSEIEPFCCRVLEERFPSVPNLGDITKINWKEAVRDFGRPDIVVGGSPCQSFSIAGSRTGLDGASGLMWEYVRAVRELRPEWLLWENVPGALSSSHGEDFRCLLESLDALGYGLAWRVLDAQFFGVAQRRERVFLVGHLGDPDGPCEVLFERGGMPWDSPSSREKRQELAAGAGGGPGVRCLPFDSTQVTSRQNGSRPKWGDACHPLCASASPPLVCMASASSGAEVMADKCPTLLARACNGAPVVSDGVSVRRVTPTECERLQGFPDDWTLIPYRGKPAEECPDTPRYKALGNSMAVNVMRWLGVRIDAVDEGENPDEACSRLRGQIFGV
jgi:DNA (cytosine-5)-methyltransferase 1